MARPAALLVTLAMASSACATVRRETSPQRIRIESEPSGATVSMETDRGARALGSTPTEVQLERVTEYVAFDPAVLILDAAFCGTTAGLVYLGAETDGGAGRSWAYAGAVAAGIVCLALAGDTISTLASRGEELRSYYRGGSPKFTATLDGYSTTSLTIEGGEPPPQPLAFALRPASSERTPAPRPQEIAVLAVFELLAADDAASASTLDQLTDYLASRLAETGRYRIVPRDEIRRALVEQKKDSYSDCVDEACQIELGKAVAAQLSLRTKLLRVGNECALSATLYDLEFEATSSGASVRTPCEAERLMDSIDELVAKLTR